MVSFIKCDVHFLDRFVCQKLYRTEWLNTYIALESEYTITIIYCNLCTSSAVNIPVVYNTVVCCHHNVVHTGTTVIL